jgi:hypothetical protein
MGARGIRREIEGLGRGRTTPIPREIRERVLAFVGEARRRGESWEEIHREIGLSASALQRWWRVRESRSRLRAVHVVADETTSARTPVAVVSPRGYRIEGLTLQQAQALLGQLG